MMDRIEALTGAMWNIDESLIQECLDADEEMEKASSSPKVLKKTARKRLLWVAAMLLLILLGGTTVYAIMRFQSEVKKEEGMISFSLDAESYKVDESLIKGQIIEAKEITKKQYEQQSPYSGVTPGYYYAELSVAAEVKAFIGYEKLIIPRMKGLEETSARVEAYVSETQKFEFATVSIFYAPIKDVWADEAAYLWTKDSPEDPGIAMRGQSILDHIKIEHRQTNGREFLLETYEDASQSDFIDCTVYWAEDTVLYSFHVRFINQEDHRAEADKLMLEWMNTF